MNGETGTALEEVQTMEKVPANREEQKSHINAVGGNAKENEEMRRNENVQAAAAEEMPNMEGEGKKRQAAAADKAKLGEEEQDKMEVENSQTNVGDAKEGRRHDEADEKNAAQEERGRRAEECAVVAHERQRRREEEAKRTVAEERHEKAEATGISQNECGCLEEMIVKRKMDSRSLEFEDRMTETGNQEKDEHDSDGDPWHDWNPEVHTALDVILQAERDSAKAAMVDVDLHDARESTTDSCVQNNVGRGNQTGDDDDDDDDDDWAPDIQGAASVEDTQNEALCKLLQPTHLIEREREQRSYETKREADAAGKLLQELKRPPTVLEAKEDIPRGPGVDPEMLPEPKYRDMTQEEAIVMVKRGATVGLPGQHSRTPLHKAAEVAYPLLCKAICDAGGDVDPRDKFGETPLLWLAHAASQYENLPTECRKETIQVLLAHGADVHAVNPRGRGVLHLASAENDHVVIDTCIEGMADVNAQDLAGFTSLMWAAGRNGVEAVKMLLNKRADANIMGIRGQTALTFALTNGNDEIVDILQQHEMLLDRESSTCVEGTSELSDDALAKPEWACKKEAPEQAEAYTGRRVYMQAKPDRHSNVYA